ncbi:hypothetical protein OAS21_00795 [Pelagibacteraceae bacterium]|jgi:hypothetical protein|nr:hypothetical protein [Pelagibacteraceae bacterium]
MKKFLFSTITFLLLFSPLSAEEKCKSLLSKLNPDCNFIGKGAKKLKTISENNKTVGEATNNIGETIKKLKKNK